jgi:hypothetical protein
MISNTIHLLRRLYQAARRLNSWTLTRTIKGDAFRGKAQARGHATAVRPRCATLAVTAKLPPIYLINNKLLLILLPLLPKPLPDKYLELRT